MATPRAVRRSDHDSDEALKWNAMIDLCAKEDASNLTQVQAKAALLFWYQSEVNNGGHNQYISNRAGDSAPEAHGALLELGAPISAALLLRAITEFGDANGQIEDGQWEELDMEFYNAGDAEVQEALTRYLRVNESEFVEWVG